MSLRVKDIDMERGQIIVRGGKGDKDRVTILPERCRIALQERMPRLRELFEQDRAAGLDGVKIEGALGRKFSRAGERWEWFWIFPSGKLSRDPDEGVMRRHHLHPKAYGEAACRRHPSPRGGPGFEDDPGASGARGHRDHPALPACRDGGERSGRAESAGLVSV
jgi:integrase